MFSYMLNFFSMCLVGPPGPVNYKMGVLTHVVNFLLNKYTFLLAPVSMTLKSNRNPGPETLINTPTNATQFHEISNSINELLNLHNALFTDITALSYSALSQLNCLGILANPQTYRHTQR